jgi:hypothetical protein
MKKRFLKWLSEKLGCCSHFHPFDHSEIIEYGDHQCVRKCNDCGETFMWP